MQWFTCKIVTPWGYVSAYASIRNKTERGALMAMRKQFLCGYGDNVFVTETHKAS